MRWLCILNDWNGFYMNWTQKQSSRNKIFPFYVVSLIFWKVKFTQTLALLSVSLAWHGFDGRLQLRFISGFSRTFLFTLSMRFFLHFKCFCGILKRICSSHWRVFVVGNTFKVDTYISALYANKSLLIIWIMGNNVQSKLWEKIRKRESNKQTIMRSFGRDLRNWRKNSFASMWADGTFISGGQFAVPLHSQVSTVGLW